MTVDEMFCRWAEVKYSLSGVTKVDFIIEEGFGGTDVTPADPPSFNVVVTTQEGRQRQWEEVELIPELIQEICEFALGAREEPDEEAKMAAFVDQRRRS